jgi:hypothetical protein
MAAFDERLKSLDGCFVEALQALEDTPEQRAYWQTQKTHWQGGGDRGYVEDYEELVRLHAELRRLMNRRARRRGPAT